jgi:hypothetical protein
MPTVIFALKVMAEAMSYQFDRKITGKNFGSSESTEGMVEPSATPVKD